MKQREGEPRRITQLLIQLDCATVDPLLPQCQQIKKSQKVSTVSRLKREKKTIRKWRCHFPNLSTKRRNRNRGQRKISEWKCRLETSMKVRWKSGYIYEFKRLSSLACARSRDSDPDRYAARIHLAVKIGNAQLRETTARCRSNVVRGEREKNITWLGNTTRKRGKRFKRRIAKHDGQRKEPINVEMLPGHEKHVVLQNEFSK